MSEATDGPTDGQTDGPTGGEADLGSDLLTSVAWPLRTERLSIRRAAAADAPQIFAIRTQPDVAQWLPSWPREETAFAASITEPARLRATLVVERDGSVIGDLMVRVEDARSQAEVKDRAGSVQAELGWVLGSAVAGQGLATEAAAALVDLCFAELGLRRVTAACFSDNTASWRVMEKLGMRREQHLLKESLHRDGRWCDSFGYALLASEWRGRATQRQATQRQATQRQATQPQAT